MPLILAVEPDKKQAAKLTSLGKKALRGFDLVVVDNAARALAAMAERRPDLVLTSLLLSPKDDAALADRLRQLDATGPSIQTLMIPLFGSPQIAPPVQESSSGLLQLFGTPQPQHFAAAPDGCEPAEFAQQILEYLDRARQERDAEAEANLPYTAGVEQMFPPAAEPSQTDARADGAIAEGSAVTADTQDPVVEDFDVDVADLIMERPVDVTTTSELIEAAAVNNPPAARAPIVDADAIEFEPALDAADSDFRELDALFAAMPPQTPAATVPETVPAMAAPAIAAPALAASAPAVVEADVPAAPSEVEAPVAAAAAVPGPQKPRARKTPARRPQKRPRRESEEDPELAGFFAALRGLPVAPTDPQ